MHKTGKFATVMKTEQLSLVINIIILLFLLSGTLWMWGVVKLNPTAQQNLEKIFERSRWRMKWLFPIAFLLIAGSYVWRNFLS